MLSLGIASTDAAITTILGDGHPASPDIDWITTNKQEYLTEIIDFSASPKQAKYIVLKYYCDANHSWKCYRLPIHQISCYEGVVVDKQNFDAVWTQQFLRGSGSFSANCYHYD